MDTRLQKFTQPLGGMPGKTTGAAAPCRAWASRHIAVVTSVEALEVTVFDMLGKLEL
jgi:hypothetical protein